MTSPGQNVGQILKLIYLWWDMTDMSIFELERRPKAQNGVNANGYLSGIFNFRYNSRYKSLLRAQNSGHFENLEILNTASRYEKTVPNYAKKFFLGDIIIINE